LKHGLFWRIGNGASVKVWGDRWIPTPISFSVQSIPVPQLASSKVEELIDKDSKWWNVSLIQDTFNPEEARVITSIPLSPNLPPDRLIWLGTNNEIFSVRSAYHLGLEIMERDKAQSSKAEKAPVVWNSLWNLPIPNSVKVFMWRACNDILPTRLNLLKRRVIDDGRCPWCNFEEETTAHAIWFCPAAKDVWNADHSIFHKCAFVDQSFLDIFQQGLNRFDRFEMALFAAIAKKIWIRRNSMIFEGVSVHPNKSYEEAVRLIDDYKRCHKGDEKKSKSTHENAPVLSCWKPLRWEPLKLTLMQPSIVMLVMLGWD
jgi:hypothetical protein